jgi:glycosyltransferase involved in cell wall biosynthesis
MKVLNVNATLDPVAGGGTAERTFQLSRFLARGGAECAVLTLDAGLTPERAAGLGPARLVALRTVLPRFYVFALPEKRIRELVRWADVVHLMGHWTLLNAMVCREAVRQGRPYAVNPAGALPIYGRSRLLKAAYNLAIGRRMVREAHACVAIGTNEFAHFERYGVPRSRVTLIPNGVDPGDFPPADPDEFRRKHDLPQAPYVLFVGRLDSIKGPDLLLEAFAAIAPGNPRTHLVFAGPDGGMLASLRAATARTGLSGRVHFVGPVRGADKARAYRGACLLAVPSRQEAMSIVAIEAGICGTPVLITDQCGFDEVGASGGGLVVPASAAGLQRGLEALLGPSADLPGMGARLREFTMAAYLWTSVVRRYLDLFERVALAPGGARKSR